MRPQPPLYQLLIGRTSVRPYATNLDQPTFETVSYAPGYFLSPRWGSGGLSWDSHASAGSDLGLSVRSAPEVPSTHGSELGEPGNGGHQEKGGNGYAPEDPHFSTLQLGISLISSLIFWESVFRLA